MFNTLLVSIRRRTKAEWQSYFKDRLEEGRSYVRENGEKASLLGFILGVLIVTFYKLALFLSCIALIAYQLVLLIAEDKSD
jgi:hypothetical protein